MALSDAENQFEVQEELAQLENTVVDDRKKAIASWAVSLSLHLTVLLICCTIAFTSMIDEKIEVPPIHITMMDKPVDVKKIDKKDIDLLEKDALIPIETDKDTIQGPVNSLDIPVENMDLNEAETLDVNDIKKGREEAISDVEMGNSGVFQSIGVGGGSAGMFGNRNGIGKIRARAKMGPWGKSTDSVTNLGLNWLRKHQDPSGKWDAENYFRNCTDIIKCEPGKLQAGDTNVAMTGLACLCYLGAGYDHITPNKYKTVIKNGISYLLSIQKDGMLGARNYEHAIATMALAEAYGMTNDPELRVPAQKAVDVLISRQAIEKPNDPYSGLLWDYVNANPSRNDLSCSGWASMALKSASSSGLNIKDSMVGAKKSIERVWKAANPDWEKKTDPYKDVTVFPYTWNAITNTTDRNHLSFVGATCAVFLGYKSGDIMLETMVNDSIERWITNGAYKKNNYSVYYLSAVLFQMGGDRWKLALDTIIPNSLETQRTSDDCFKGSWDYVNQNSPGSDTGRVLSTCFNILNLEIAYRYAQVHTDVKLKAK